MRFALAPVALVLAAAPLGIAVSGCSRPEQNTVEIITAVTGVVRDAETGAPLERVEISTEPPSDTALTDAGGAYRLQTGIEPRRVYRITATRPGYQAAQAIYAAVEGVDSTVDMSLAPARAVLALSRSDVDLGTRSTVETIAIQNLGDADTELSWQATAVAAWITGVEPSEGTVTDTAVPLTITVDRSALGDTFGPTQSSVEITSNGGSQTLVVAIENPNPDTPVLAVTPLSLDFGTQATRRTIAIRNAGTGTLRWSTQSEATWVRTEPASGELDFGPRALIDVVIERAGLGAGAQTAELQIVGEGGLSRSVSLVAEIVEEPVTELSTRRLDFGESESSAEITLRNAGNGTMRYLIDAPGVPWLSIEGTLDDELAGGQSVVLKLSVDRSQVQPGRYSYEMGVRSRGGDRVLTVLMSAEERPSLRAVVAPIELGAADQGVLTLENDGTGNVAWQLTSAPPWLRLNPTAGVIVRGFGQPPSRSDVDLFVDRSDLPAGPFSGALVLETTAGPLSIDIRGERTAAAWRQLTVAGSPEARDMAGMAWDPVRSVAVLHGGHDGEVAIGNSSRGQIFADVWNLDGERWTRQLGIVDTPGRLEAQGLWVPSAEALWFFGDEVVGLLGPTLFDGSAWGGPTGEEVWVGNNHYGSGIAFDSQSGRYLSFCGGGYHQSSQPAGAQILMFTEGAWSRAGGLAQRCRGAGVLVDEDAGMALVAGTPCPEGGSCEGLQLFKGPLPREAGFVSFEALGEVPPELQRHGFTPVVRGDRLLLFGGWDLTGELRSDVISVDIDGNITLFGAENPPPARSGAAVAYVPGRDELWLFGGHDGDEDLADTWILDFDALEAVR